MHLLHCPMCEFAALPSDEYVLQLHFEQLHTNDSPFRIQDETEVSPPRSPARPSSDRDKNVSSLPSEDEDDEESFPPLSSRPSSKKDKHTGGIPSENEEANSVLCPEPECGELILLADFNEHLDYHAAETLSFDETTGKYRTRPLTNMHGLYTTTNSKTLSKSSVIEHDFNDAALPDTLRRNDDKRKLKKVVRRGRGDSSGSEKSTLSRSMASFIRITRYDKKVKPPQCNGKLGKEELGPYHDEDRMPKWLHDQLAAGPKITVVNRIGRDGRLIKHEQVENETPGIIPILAQLSALDRSVKEAYYCHPSTLHIGKTKNEGGFCGYRNIQMLVSYIQGARAQGIEEFPGRTPGILKLQDFIERAWDKGINEIGRVQTGGIKDSRKYIGTPEAQALFLNSEIDCEVDMFSDSPDGKFEAHGQLLLGVEKYFARAAADDGSNVHKTLLPPIYLQQPGHSTTIVGFERHRNGTCNLMVFDPMPKTSPAMHRLIGRKNIKTSRPEVLYPYRRAAKQLRRHAAFEVLKLTAHPPMVPVWDMLRQFPDCRFLYVFFRSRTLGYDVYPEDYFLRNFPWQQYGGLWIVDDVRFARSAQMNPLTSQALRRITGEGSSSGTSIFRSVNGSSSDFIHQYFSPTPLGTRNEASSRLPSFMSTLDGSVSGYGAVSSNIHGDYLDPVLDMVGMHTVRPLHNNSKLQSPTLFPMTELESGFPGYPSPLSPTGDAKIWYPSPASECGSSIAIARAGSPGRRAGSPMSIDGSSMCGPSRRCMSHGYEIFMDRCDTTASNNGHVQPSGTLLPSCSSLASDGRSSAPYPSPHSAIRSPSTSSISPITPPRTISPRTAMLKNMVGKHALEKMSHNPNPFSPPVQHHHAWPSPNHPLTSTSLSTSSCNPNPTDKLLPISASSTDIMLSYTSNRAVDSGLLAVKPLSEAQVAEYVFWRPCGRRACAFGCGEGSEGECSAAKRLFRREEEVLE